MSRRLFATLSFCASAGALACPLCLGGSTGTLGVDLTQAASATRNATSMPVLPQ